MTFEGLKVLDSPLLDSLAPELVPFRLMVTELQKKVVATGCSACDKRQAVAGLAEIEIKLQDKLRTVPALAAVIPLLKAST
jgi:hypothetical protein